MGNVTSKLTHITKWVAARVERYANAIEFNLPSVTSIQLEWGPGGSDEMIRGKVTEMSLDGDGDEKQILR